MMGLDVPRSTVDGGPLGRLGNAEELTALDDPPPFAARLDVVPETLLQREASVGWSRRLRRRTVPVLSTVVIHLGFAAAFAFLLTWREGPDNRDVEIPVEVVAETPPAAPPAPPKAPSPEPPKPQMPELPAAPAPPSPEPKAEPQAREEPTPQAPKPPDDKPAVPPVPAPPPLVAPPPDAAPAATQAEVNRPANLEPDPHAVETATHEARPPDRPDVLTTTDPAAAFAVPNKAEPKPDPVPAPAVPAKVPSETDKLAAALPMDTSAMPSSFRAVLSGSGSFVGAAYKGVVFGRLGRDPGINEKARRQHLRGQVLVSFSIDDEGQVKDLSVLQTSGNPAVDALGLAMIRAAAPFPPPPPDSQRVFTPALTFGE